MPVRLAFIERNCGQIKKRSAAALALVEYSVMHLCTDVLKFPEIVSANFFLYFLIRDFI